jgi:hypothetical protein
MQCLHYKPVSNHFCSVGGGGGGLRSPGIIFKESIRPTYAGVPVRQPFLCTGGVYYALYTLLQGLTCVPLVSLCSTCQREKV